jgi:hypothetical protein
MLAPQAGSSSADLAATTPLANPPREGDPVIAFLSVLNLPVMNPYKSYVALALFLAGVLSSHATVYFQNTGTVPGNWSTSRPQSGTQGRVVQVSSPTYKGSTAILYEQKFLNEYRGYHSECTVAKAIAQNQDRYFGQAIYFPSSWQSIDSNATFQQWSPENPEGPWILNWRQGNDLYINGDHNRKLTGCSSGVWIRVVVRLKTTNPGALEVWVNGTKRLSDTDGTSTGRGYVIKDNSPTARWSTGLYVTWWRDPSKTVGQTTRQIYHDHHRIASSYSEAEPANW